MRTSNPGRSCATRVQGLGAARRARMPLSPKRPRRPGSQAAELWPRQLLLAGARGCQAPGAHGGAPSAYFDRGSATPRKKNPREGDAGDGPLGGDPRAVADVRKLSNLVTPASRIDSNSESRPDKDDVVPTTIHVSSAVAAAHERMVRARLDFLAPDGSVLERSKEIDVHLPKISKGSSTLAKIEIESALADERKLAQERTPESTSRSNNVGCTVHFHTFGEPAARTGSNSGNELCSRGPTNCWIDSRVRHDS